MNKVILMGRLTRDPEVRYSTGEKSTAVARYTLAVDRRFKRNDSEQNADFPNPMHLIKSAFCSESFLLKRRSTASVYLATAVDFSPVE